MTLTVTPPSVSTPSTSFISNSLHPNYERTRSTRQSGTHNTGDDENHDEVLPSVYPPLNDDEADTSRVVENLRQWEVAERQKRKAARESAAPSSSPSVMGHITQLLWPGRKSSTGFGTHVALQSQENIGSVSLRNLDISPSPSPMSESSPVRRWSEESHPDNPFANPPESFPSFPGIQDQKKVSARISGPSHSILPPTRSATILGLSQAPPKPMTLDLHLVEASSLPTSTPPHPTLSPGPASHFAHGPADDHKREGRWWHDWLCGCSEGSDRGGDCQAGRTNPFE